MGTHDVEANPRYAGSRRGGGRHTVGDAVVGETVGDTVVGEVVGDTQSAML
jgi:uncharacterized protein YjaZ